MAQGRRATERRGGEATRPAVSLVEVLVVTAIVALMLAMLFPSLYAARERMRRVMCANNLRQWGVALHHYREDHHDYLPTEGANWDLDKPGTWFNTLPLYLNIPAYKEVERIEDQIKEFPALHVWICPSKNLTGAYKSGSGKNQFHYGMNQVLDGLGKAPKGSKDTPGFPDWGDQPVRAHRFSRNGSTVFMFDIAPNSPAGTQRQVATKYQRTFSGGPMGKFHGDYANILHLVGRVSHCTTDNLVTGHDFRHGDLVWDHPGLYWGWLPPTR